MEPANDNRVSPWAWMYLLIAAVCDLIKILLFFLNGIPVIGTVIDVAGSFIISVIEIIVVFGGLWFIGVYKGKSSVQNTLITMGVATADLVPIVDDIPFTSPTVLYMIMKAYAASKLSIGPAVNDNEESEEKAA